MSPATTIQLGKLGGMGVLNLRACGPAMRPQPVLDEIATLEAQSFSPENTARLQQLYAAPIQPELISARLEEIREAGVVVAGALTQRTQEFYKTVVDAGVDMFVIRGNGFGATRLRNQRTTGFEKVYLRTRCSSDRRGVAGYTPALHLMRTGAAGVLVSFGGEHPRPHAGPWVFACPWPLPSLTSSKHAATTWTNPVVVTSTSLPTADWATRAILSSHRHGCRRRHAGHDLAR